MIFESKSERIWSNIFTWIIILIDDKKKRKFFLYILLVIFPVISFWILFVTRNSGKYFLSPKKGMEKNVSLVFAESNGSLNWFRQEQFGYNKPKIIALRDLLHIDIDSLHIKRSMQFEYPTKSCKFLSISVKFLFDNYFSKS